MKLALLSRAAVFFYLSVPGAKGKLAEGAFLNQESFLSMHADLN